MSNESFLRELESERLALREKEPAEVRYLSHNGKLLWQMGVMATTALYRIAEAVVRRSNSDG